MCVYIYTRMHKSAQIHESKSNWLEQVFFLFEQVSSDDDALEKRNEFLLCSVDKV